MWLDSGEGKRGLLSARGTAPHVFSIGRRSAVDLICEKSEMCESERSLLLLCSWLCCYKHHTVHCNTHVTSAAPAPASLLPAAIFGEYKTRLDHTSCVVHVVALFVVGDE